MKYKTVIFIGLIISSSLLFSQKKVNNIEDICLNKNEFRLYCLINKIRVENDKPILPLSASLTFVSKKHADDLNKNHPDTAICDLHSWSDKGIWSPCCHNKYLPKSECIRSKPGELTDYNYHGYELVYWDSEFADPDSLIELWTHTDKAVDMILNSGKWEYYEWNITGLSINNKYATVWFGEEKDPADPVTLCNTGKIITTDEIINEISRISEKPIVFLPKTDSYHIIFGSYTDLTEVEKLVEKYRNADFPNAGIIRGKNNFRISLMHFPSLQEAKKANEQLDNQYENAWILKY